jgi:hypothetical protein
MQSKMPADQLSQIIITVNPANGDSGTVDEQCGKHEKNREQAQ